MRSQQTEHNQTGHHPELKLSAKVCEFHPAFREETDTRVQEEDTPQAQDGVLGDVLLEEEPHDRLLEDMIVEEDGHRVEAKTVRRSQRTARPKEMFTYGTIGQPSYQQWNAGVNSLLPSYPLPRQLGAVPIPYFTHPHPYYHNCFTQAY